MKKIKVVKRQYFFTVFLIIISLFLSFQNEKQITTLVEKYSFGEIRYFVLINMADFSFSELRDETIKCSEEGSLAGFCFRTRVGEDGVKLIINRMIGIAFINFNMLLLLIRNNQLNALYHEVHSYSVTS